MEPEPVQETREPQRLYAPSRSALRPAGAPPAPPATPATPATPSNTAEPWTADGWQPAAQPPDYTARSGGRAILGRAAVLALIALCNLVFVVSPRSTHLKDLVALLDVLGIVVLADILMRLWQARRRMAVRWTTFPAFLGGRLDGVLLVRPALEPIGAARAVLRCVRDQRAVHDGGGASFEPTVLYQQISEIPIPEDRMRQLPLSFALPADLPGTDLARDDATYWQVALRIPVVGPDLEIVFLAPVYAPRA
jgi:hypothetical protein